MPSGIAQTPSDAPVGQMKKGAASSVATIPFARASKWHVEQGNTVSGIVVNTPSPGTFNFPIPSYGYLSAVLLTITGTGGVAGAGVLYEDAPWSAFGALLLSDVNGTPIIQLSGYHAFLASKWGGYRLFGTDISAKTSIYNAPASGNFQACLPLFLEFGVDGLGCLPNMDASARYNLQVILNSFTATATTGPVFTTAPTTYPVISLLVEALCRSQPPATDMFGNQNSVAPPSVGTVGYWTAQTFSSLSGAQTLQLSRVGNLIRNHVLIFRDATNGTRGTAETSDLPPLFEFDWDVGQRYIGAFATLRNILALMSQGYDPPNGVLLFPNTLDPDKIAISEYGDEWMPTVGATKLTFRFTPAANCNLTVLTNDIVPASGQVYAAAALAVG